MLFQLDFYSMLALLGLSNMMIVRMQCIDFKHRNKIFRTFHDMARNDRLWMLFRGVPALVACQIFFQSGIVAAQMLKSMLHFHFLSR